MSLYHIIIVTILIHTMIAMFSVCLRVGFPIRVSPTPEYVSTNPKQSQLL